MNMLFPNTAIALAFTPLAVTAQGTNCSRVCRHCEQDKPDDGKSHIGAQKLS